MFLTNLSKKHILRLSRKHRGVRTRRSHGRGTSRKNDAEIGEEDILQPDQGEAEEDGIELDFDSHTVVIEDNNVAVDSEKS